MLEFFALGHRLLVRGLLLDILEPLAQGVHLHAAVDQFLASHLVVKLVEFLDRTGDLLDGVIVVVLGDQLGADGPDLHHDCLRAELLEALPDFILHGVVLHEVEQLEDVLGVTFDGLVILQLEVADAAVVILDGLLLELRAFVGVDTEVVILAAVFFAVPLEADQEMVEQGRVPERPLAVGAELRVHLQQAEVDPQLQFFHTALALDPARIHAAKAVVPVF